MKLNISTILMALTLTVAAGCGSGAKTAAIMPVDGSTGSSKPSPASPSDGSGSSDEIVAPKDAAPAPAPVPATGDSVSDDSKTPLPTPPKAPETPSVATPPIILYFPPTTPASVPPVVSSLAVEEGSLVETPEGSGPSEGAAATFRCGKGQVVTGFEYAHEDIDAGCGEGWSSGCGPEIHMAALRITCTPLSLAGADNSKPEPAFVMPTAATVAGKTDASMNSDPSATNCKAGVGIATGVVGRVDGELKSFGLACGHFHAWKEGVAILPTFNRTVTCADESGSDYEYGCSPGFGGAPFEKSCDTNQAVTGVSIKYSGERVLGITGILCGNVKPVLMKPIFGFIDK
ncbi:MAG TPA: hypothetical protein VFX30_02515 [bacterium]|nr:hypothetical protein [bacterium]